jgi:hypothetical protein
LKEVIVFWRGSDWMVVTPTAAMRGETMILRVRSVRARENINLQFPVAISNRRPGAVSET